MSRIAESMMPGPYGALPGHKEPTTSRDAARAVAGDASTLREKVYAAVLGAGARGLTADEAAVVVERTPFAVRPRFTELAKASPPRIKPTGERRANDSGLKAKAWRAC